MCVRGGEGSLEPVDEKHTSVAKPWDLYTARELHLTYVPVICNIWGQGIAGILTFLFAKPGYMPSTAVTFLWSKPCSNPGR